MLVLYSTMNMITMASGVIRYSNLRPILDFCVMAHAIKIIKELQRSSGVRTEENLANAVTLGPER